MKYKSLILNIVTRIISSTWKFKIIDNLDLENGVIAFWHGQMLPVWKYFSYQSHFALISKSKDGQLLANLLSSWGFKLVRGSSSNPDKVMENMIDIAKYKVLLITPDGPRGPVNKLKAGAVVAANRAESNAIFLKVEISNKWIFNKSWDKFEFPKPFATIIITIADKYEYSKSHSRLDISNFLNRIEENMNK